MHAPLYDLHIHTNFSVCSSDPAQTVENIAKYASSHGISAIAITNHVWDCDVPAGSDFYARQPFSPIMRIRDQIPQETHGVRAILSCITDDEFAGCFTLARQHNTALELNGAELGKAWNVPEALREYERMFSIARDCGCAFTMGSDAHAIFALDNICYSVKTAEKLGISDDCFLKI